AVVVMLAAYLTLAGISRPIKKIAFILVELANGNFEIEIGGTERKDEVGDIARAALVFRDCGHEAERLRAAREQAKIQAEADHRAALIAMADAIEIEAGRAVAEVQTLTD